MSITFPYGDPISPETFIARKKHPRPSGGQVRPLRLDIGTADIVVCAGGAEGETTRREANAFFTVPALPNTRKILEDKAVRFFEKGNRLHVIGNAAEEFANILGGTTRRPMENGLVNLKEDDGIQVIQAILDPMIPPPEKKGRSIWFSAPGDPLDQPGAVMFNASIFKTYLKGRGYAPRPINEAMAVVAAELADQHASGIGISLGGGMCNICFSYLSIPAVTYSIQKGGDFIDRTVGRSVGEAATKIKGIKEQALDLGVAPRNNIERVPPCPSGSNSCGGHLPTRSLRARFPQTDCVLALAVIPSSSHSMVKPDSNDLARCHDPPIAQPQRNGRRNLHQHAQRPEKDQYRGGPVCSRARHRRGCPCRGLAPPGEPSGCREHCQDPGGRDGCHPRRFCRKRDHHGTAPLGIAHRHATAGGTGGAARSDPDRQDLPSALPDFSPGGRLRDAQIGRAHV